MEPELTAKEASNLLHLEQLAAHTGTRLVPLGDHALLCPRTSDHPRGHLLDLAEVLIPPLCYHFPVWVARDPKGWPNYTLEQLAAPPWA